MLACCSQTNAFATHCGQFKYFANKIHVWFDFEATYEIGSLTRDDLSTLVKFIWYYSGLFFLGLGMGCLERIIAILGL